MKYSGTSVAVLVSCKDFQVDIKFVLSISIYLPST